MTIMTWDLHVDDLQVNHNHNMILGNNIWYELNIYLCISNNEIRVNGGTYRGFTTTTKDVLEINFNVSYLILLIVKSFGMNNYARANTN